MTWEDKFGHGSTPGPGILSSGFPSLSDFGNILRPEYLGKELGHGLTPGSAIYPSVLPPHQKFGHSLRPEFVGEGFGAVVLSWEKVSFGEVHEPKVRVLSAESQKKMFFHSDVLQ